MMEIIKHGKNVYMTADGHNVSKAVKEILTRDKPKGKAEPICEDCGYEEKDCKCTPSQVHIKRED